MWTTSHNSQAGKPAILMRPISDNVGHQGRKCGFTEFSISCRAAFPESSSGMALAAGLTCLLRHANEV
jgi:hypothetical protein